MPPDTPTIESLGAEKLPLQLLSINTCNSISPASQSLPEPRVTAERNYQSAIAMLLTLDISDSDRQKFAARINELEASLDRRNSNAKKYPPPLDEEGIRIMEEASRRKLNGEL